eukprot:SAG31_NODE_1265_length_9070_cov_5.167205_7_plen_54_part_00
MDRHSFEVVTPATPAVKTPTAHTDHHGVQESRLRAGGSSAWQEIKDYVSLHDG